MSPEIAITILAAVAAFGTVYVVWMALLVPDLMSVRAKRSASAARNELRADMMSHASPAQGRGHGPDATRSSTVQPAQVQDRKQGRGAPGSGRMARQGRVVIVPVHEAGHAVRVWRGHFCLVQCAPRHGPARSIAAAFAACGGRPGRVRTGAFRQECDRNEGKRSFNVACRTLSTCSVICAEAGLSLDAALNRVAQEMKRGRSRRSPRRLR